MIRVYIVPYRYSKRRHSLMTDRRMILRTLDGLFDPCLPTVNPVVQVGRIRI